MDFDKPKVYGDTFISDGLVLSRRWSALKSSEKIYFLMVVNTFQKFEKVLQRYIFPRFAKIYLAKVVVSSQHTCLTLATLYLPSIGPAPVNLLRSGPGLVTENQQVMRVDHYWRMMALDDYQQMKRIVASTSDASTRLVIRLLPKCLPQTTAVSHRWKIKYVHCILI